MVEAAEICTDGPVMVAAAEKVVEAVRVVTALEREVEQSAAPVEISGWPIVGGHRSAGGLSVRGLYGWGEEDIPSE